MEGLSILPKVKKVSYQEGNLKLSSIVIHGDTEDGVKKVCSMALGQVQYGLVQVNLTVECSELGEEEYKIQITQKGINLQYASMRGLFYGCITVKHIRKQYRGYLPCMDIWDYPDIPNRGILYDISRNKVPKLETLYLLVDMMADLKYNQLQLYVEGLSFEYESFREYLKEECYMKKEEVGLLQEYCSNRFIAFIPNQNTLGHMTDWLSIKDFSHLARNPEGELAFGTMHPPGTLNPEQVESKRFVENLTKDMLPYFSSPYYNVNMDESFGITEPNLYKDWLYTMYEITREHGKKMMMWSDMLLSFDQEIGDIPRDIILLDWGYEDHYPFDTECKILKEKNLDFYLCPGTSSWCSLTGRTDNMILNVDKAIDCAHRYGAKGIIMTDWGDAGHWQVFPISYPGFVYAAARAWNKEEVNMEELSNYLDVYVFEDSNRQMGKLSLMIGRTYQFDDFRLLNGSMFHHQLVMGLCSKEDFNTYVQKMKNWMIPYANRFYEDGGKELIYQIETNKEFDYSGINTYIKSMKCMLEKAHINRNDAEWIILEYEQSLGLLQLAADIRAVIENTFLLHKGERDGWIEGLKEVKEEKEEKEVKEVKEVKEEKELLELKNRVYTLLEVFKKTWRYRNKESHLEKSIQMFSQLICQITSLEEK
ncbi:MAG: family 20 glycosylhydrolase [Anaerocolumna sp.]